MKKRLSFRQLRVNEFRTHHLSRILSLILLVLATFGIYLYWRGSLELTGLFFWFLGLLVVALLFLFGVQMARRQGFIDGFRNGRDGIKKAKKKT